MFPADINATSSAWGRARMPWVFLLAFVAYSILFGLVHWTARQAGGITPIWLTTGLGIWLVLNYGSRMLPAIILGGLPSYWLSGFDLGTVRVFEAASLAAAGRALGAWSGAWLWRWSQDHRQKLLGRFGETGGCVLVALTAPALAATVGVGGSTGLGFVPPSDFSHLWLHWWAGDAIGIMFSLPLLLGAPELVRRLRSAPTPNLSRLGMLLGAIAAADWVVFEWPGGIKFLAILFPVLLLATIWFGALGARLVAFLFACLITFAAVRGQGPFVLGNSGHNDLSLQFLLMAVGLVALVLPAIHARRSLSQRLPLILLLGGWTAGGMIFALVQGQQERANADDFSRLTENARHAIELRLTAYVDALRSAAGFLATMPSVGPREWHEFAGNLQLSSRYPGIKGIGVVYPVPAEQTEKFLQQVRSDGAAGFAIRTIESQPAGSREHYVVTMIDPLAGNEPALGLDLASETYRRVAAETARDSGAPQITRRITLMQDPARRSGFLLFHPVYQPGAPLTTVAERRSAFRAWVYAPFVTDIFFLEGLRERREKLRLSVFDQGELDDAHLVFSTDSSRLGKVKFARVNLIRIGEQEIILGWNPGPGFVPNQQSLLLWLSMSLAVVTVLLTEFVLSLQAFREQAESRSLHHLAALRESETRFRAIFEQAAMGVALVDLANGRFVRVNRRFCQILGFSADELLATDFQSVTHPEDISVSSEAAQQLAARRIPEYSLEKRYRHKDGHVVWGRLNVATMSEEGAAAAFAIGTLEDITERKQASEALRQEHEFNARVLDSVADHIAVVDRDSVILSVNHAWRQFAAHNGAPHLGATVVGTNYLQVCGAASPSGAEADSISIGLRDVLAGTRDYFQLEYPCHSPTEKRWFQVSVTHLAGPQSGAVISHKNITARKEAENALQHERDRLRQILDSQFGLVAVLSLTGEVIEINQAPLTLAGLSRADVMGRIFWEIGWLEPDGKRHAREAIASAAKGATVRHDIGAEFPTLGRRDIDAIFSPLRDAAGVVINVIGFGVDVTERKQSEDLLQRTNRALRMISECDKELVRATTEANLLQTVCRIIVEEGEYQMAWVGFAEDDAVRSVRPVAQFGFSDGYLQTVNITWADDERGRGPTGTAIRTGQVAVMRDIADDPAYTPWRTAAIQRGYASSLSLPLRGGGRTIGALMIYSSVRDAFGPEETELLAKLSDNLAYGINSLRTRAEHERGLAALRLNEFSVQHASVATLWIARDARILRVNLATCDLLGYTEAEILALSVTDLDPNFPVERWPLHWQELREKGRLSFETRQRHKSGRLIAVEVELTWFEYEGREYNFAFVHDITATRALEQQLRQSQKLEAVGTLAGGIAHDFNNILSGIYGFTSLARGAAGGNAELRSYLDEINRASRRAAELVRQILTFSRTRGGEENWEPVQAGAVVADAVKLLRATSPSSIEFVQECAPELPSVPGNASQLHQVVMNLGTNAVHAMGHGTGRLTIRLAAVTVDDGMARSLPGLTVGPYVCLTVNDTGSGMDAAIRDRVFEPFFTTKGPGEGTGLGLSVVHGIVRDHHGAVRLTTEPGRGTTFEVFLPAGTLAPASRPAAHDAAQRGRGERILIVDDEEMIARVGKLTLCQLGYAAESETDVLKALGRLERDPHAFHLVLSDQTMPGMTGLEFAARIRALRPDLPVVLATGHSTAVTPENIRASGIREVLMKPYSTEVLADVLRRHLSPPQT